jgi:hypothetical protein
VISSSRSQEHELTGDVQKLVEQIEKVVPAPQGNSDDFSWCFPMSAYEAYQIDEHQDPGDQVLHAKMSECARCRLRVCPEFEIRWLARAVWTHARTNSNSALGVVDGLVNDMAKLPGQRPILLTSAEFFMYTLYVEVDRYALGPAGIFHPGSSGPERPSSR